MLHPLQTLGDAWADSGENAKYAFVSLSVPGSKSFTNRAAVLAGLLGHAVRLSGVLFSDDSFWAFECLKRLGYEVTLCPENNEVTVAPPSEAFFAKSFGGTENTAPVSLYFGMAGTLARFFPAVVLNYAHTHKKSWKEHWCLQAIATGEKRLCERPLRELTVALREMGGTVRGEALPLHLETSPLQGHCVVSGSKSGQFLSGLLLAAAGSGNEVSIQRTENLVQPDYVRMTLQAISQFGVSIQHSEELTEFKVAGGQRLSAESFHVEADASTACYFLAAAVLLNIELKIENIGSNSLQPDVHFVTFLEKLGVPVQILPGSLQVGKRKGPITGGFAVDFSACSDQALTAGILALFASDKIEVKGIAHIREHESDRIACLVSNLKALGVNFAEWHDGFASEPAKQKLSGLWPTHHDHRFAMCGFLLALRNPEVEILDPACVAKTAPAFFTLMKLLGASYQTKA